jgi:hypothetical protein
MPDRAGELVAELGPTSGERPVRDGVVDPESWDPR